MLPLPAIEVAAESIDEKPIQTVLVPVIMAIGGAYIDITIGADVALPPTHVALDVITQYTELPLDNAELEYVGLLDPTALPLRYHWYVGEVPPLTGVAVNVTFAPEQIGFTEAAIETLAVRVGLTNTE
jgi:hypothetical protein